MSHKKRIIIRNRANLWFERSARPTPIVDEPSLSGLSSVQRDRTAITCARLVVCQMSRSADPARTNIARFMYVHGRHTDHKLLARRQASVSLGAWQEPLILILYCDM
jgi:hypothetical protein